MTGTTRIARSSLLCLALWACRSEESAKTPKELAPVADSTAPAEGDLRLKFDGQEIALIRAKKFVGPVKLIDLLPADKRDWSKWVQVEALSLDGRRLAIPEPSTRYRDHTPSVYRSAEGWLSIGWFSNATSAGKEQAAPRLKLVRAAEVRIHTSLPTKTLEAGGIEVLLPGRKQPLLVSGASLDALTVHRPTSTDDASRAAGKRMRGWKLRDVVALAADVADVESFALYGEGEDSKAFAGAALLANNGETIVMKRNKRGLLMVRWLDSDGKRQQIAGLVRIELRHTTAKKD